jgi:hypothetical protein
LSSALRDELQERRTTERHATSALYETQDALAEWIQSANEAEAERNEARAERDRLLGERARLEAERDQWMAGTFPGWTRVA